MCRVIRGNLLTLEVQQNFEKNDPALAVNCLIIMCCKFKEDSAANICEVCGKHAANFLQLCRSFCVE